MLGDFRAYQLGLVLLQGLQGRNFIGAHQSTVADNVGREDGS